MRNDDITTVIPTVRRRDKISRNAATAVREIPTVIKQLTHISGADFASLSEGDRMSVHLSLERLYHVLTDIELAAMILGKK